MRRWLALPTALVAVGFLACGPKIDPRLVQRWAARDFDCDDRVVDVQRLEDAGHYRARGCGHSQEYTCQEVAEDAIHCTPVTTVAGPVTVGTPLPSSCDCSHPHSVDEPSSAPASTTPVMPQKPYRQ